MWPGQAMSLRVNQILHVEKSKYQDVSCKRNWAERNELTVPGSHL